MKKGFVISIDALLGLLILFIIITLAFDSMVPQGGNFSQRQRLREFAFFAGVALEESNLLSKAVIANNTTSIRSFLDAWPSSICGTVSIFPSPDSNSAVLIVSKSNCTTSLGAQESAQMGFIVPSPPDANMYAATITTWVNQS